jgi:hypothetical protein
MFPRLAVPFAFACLLGASSLVAQNQAAPIGPQRPSASDSAISDGPFDQARDAFAWSLDKEGAYRVVGFVPLGNSIIGAADEGSGDHDGLALYREAVR